MNRYSLLDLAAVPEGSDAGTALVNTRDLAQRAEALGFHRYWLAEHHNMPGIASAATSIVIGHVAEATSTIRVGSGGVMLPNHAPLVVAEQFGTLATLYPGRIDLGLGRAPGTDMQTAMALRRNMQGADRFPEDVVEIMGYFADGAEHAKVQAVPGAGTNVPVWILGSSLYGAQLAAHLGLPYAFASHFAPAMLEEASYIYRTRFQPSQYLSEPYFMMAMGVCAADSDEEAEYQRSSQILSFARLRTGRPGKLPAPTHDLSEVPAEVMAGVEQAFSCSAVGGPQTVRRRIEELVERHRPDEVMITGMMHDHAARVRSTEIAAEILSDMAKPAATAAE
ncbi:LLM class flavin-dependent oxidoreductase [Pseudoroseicyclus tamaricis]|uniref:Luciferase-like monooxygenase n=1 Tax=Pseudoroseicyclus tamaricis TaxID=2705421 RepID=A0A6B2JP13_9RHOB|nr:LLM class flavin-dependent oxidoreductase [Pseudoroseicyclus tamaricis]NDU99729.1 LLM class flavin-dependent oxidoreductase [Pseudoroseicyclus tamaricis]